MLDRVVWAWRRIRGGWRCALHLHRWRGYHDLGDDVNVQPISGYRKPHGAKDFRRCTWCGASTGALRCGDDRTRFFIWARVHEMPTAAGLVGPDAPTKEGK